MGARLRSWWQKISKPLKVLGIIVVCTLTITLLVMIALTYIFNVDIPGLHGKTLWDWLQLLIIPAVLAVGGYLLNYTTSRNERQATEQRAQVEREAAEKRAQTERDIASDNQREAALQTYIDKISELLCERNLRESQPEDEVQIIARVRTLTTLPRLDATRKGSVIQFLYESQLISKNKNIIDLGGANLSRANLSRANLNGANLNGANLLEADLSNATFIGADLSGANLGGANLLSINLKSSQPE